MEIAFCEGLTNFDLVSFFSFVIDIETQSQ